jgi:hypothetical protein
MRFTWFAGTLIRMAVIPQTVYARDGDVNLAYQVAGSSGPDLLFVPTPRFPIDLIWDDHTVAGHLRRLSSFGRLILTDLLGVGGHLISHSPFPRRPYGSCPQSSATPRGQR